MELVLYSRPIGLAYSIISASNALYSMYKNGKNYANNNRQLTTNRTDKQAFWDGARKHFWPSVFDALTWPVRITLYTIYLISCGIPQKKIEQ